MQDGHRKRPRVQQDDLWYLWYASHATRGPMSRLRKCCAYCTPSWGGFQRRYAANTPRPAGTYFCWKCVKPITGYEHFYAGGDCVLFDQAEIDHWNRQQVRPAAGDLHAGRYAGHAARIGGGPLRMRSCPRCRQRNAKVRAGRFPHSLPNAGTFACCGHAAEAEHTPCRVQDGRNNHMSCWNCLNNFCYQCNAVLRKVSPLRPRDARRVTLL